VRLKHPPSVAFQKFLAKAQIRSSPASPEMREQKHISKEFLVEVNSARIAVGKSPFDGVH